MITTEKIRIRFAMGFYRFLLQYNQKK